MSEFPPNSFASKGQPEDEEPEDKGIEQITAESARRRKKPIKKRFTGLFFGGDAKTAANYVAFEVLIPAAKDMIADAGSSLIEKIIFGENRYSRRRTGVMQSDRGSVQYNRMFGTQQGPMTPATRQISQRARAQHDFDEIMLDTRPEAQAVVDQMFEVLRQWESISVADLYAMVGLPSTHVDRTWGWTALEGAGVSKVRGGGYVLDLPEPRRLV